MRRRRAGLSGARLERSRGGASWREAGEEEMERWRAAVGGGADERDRRMGLEPRPRGPGSEGGSSIPGGDGAAPRAVHVGLAFGRPATEGTLNSTQAEQDEHRGSRGRRSPGRAGIPGRARGRRNPYRRPAGRAPSGTVPRVDSHRQRRTVVVLPASTEQPRPDGTWTRRSAAPPHRVGADPAGTGATARGPRCGSSADRAAPYPVSTAGVPQGCPAGDGRLPLCCPRGCPTAAHPW